jgi:hypothetical protein
MPTNPKRSNRTARNKKRYHTPHLAIYGDLRRLTMAKIGNKSDGAGKPATRASGGNA